MSFLVLTNVPWLRRVATSGTRGEEEGCLHYFDDSSVNRTYSPNETLKHCQNKRVDHQRLEGERLIEEIAT